MRITGVGVNRAMKNLAAARQQARLEKKEEERYAQERKDKKLNILLGIKAKYGSGAIASLFPGENIYEAPGVEDVSEEESDESLTSSSLYSQTNKEIVAMEQLRAPESKGGYGLDDETIAKFKANGDSDVFQRILKKVRPIKQDFISKGRDFPSAALQSIVEGAVLANSSPSGKINLTAIEKVIGGKLDDLSKAILLQQEQPRGSIQLGDYFYAEQVSIEDLDKFEKRALSENLTRAKSDLLKVIKELSTLDKLTDPISQGTKNWLTKKKVEIETSIENYEKDDVFDLAGLYGMFYSKKLLDYYPNFVDAPINTAVLNASKKIITVPNAEVGDQLAKSGLLLQGEIVLNQQTGRPLPIGFNEEYWESDIGQNLLKQFVEQM